MRSARSRACRSRRRRRALFALCGLAALASACDDARTGDVVPGPEWSASERELLRSLSLEALPNPPPPVSNRVGNEPRAIALGRRLFYDPGLSRNGAISCATCHAPERHFTDGRRTSRGLGGALRNAPTVVGAAYSPWLFWDGRRDSLWAQALAPLEAEGEMGSTRLAVARYVSTAPQYARTYRALFGDPPDLEGLPERAGPFGDATERSAWSEIPERRRRQVDAAFANAGKAIAAYERTLVPGPARFDRYVAAILAGDEEAAARAMSPEEVAGLRLFLDGERTRCVQCHNGPLLSNHAFHDIGTGRRSGTPDLGRFVGIESLRLDPFNCLGPYSDAPPEACRELKFLAREGSGRRVGAFRTPTLREVAHTAPYLHDGSLDRLEDVVAYYRDPPRQPPNELVPLDLSDEEARQLVAFLATLSGGFVERGPREAAQVREGCVTSSSRRSISDGGSC